MTPESMIAEPTAAPTSRRALVELLINAWRDLADVRRECAAYRELLSVTLHLLHELERGGARDREANQALRDELRRYVAAVVRGQKGAA
jgi:hypothetical protein